MNLHNLLFDLDEQFDINLLHEVGIARLNDCGLYALPGRRLALRASANPLLGDTLVNTTDFVPFPRIRQKFYGQSPYSKQDNLSIRLALCMALDIRIDCWMFTAPQRTAIKACLVERMATSAKITVAIVHLVYKFNINTEKQRDRVILADVMRVPSRRHTFCYTEMGISDYRVLIPTSMHYENREGLWEFIQNGCPLVPTPDQELLPYNAKVENHIVIQPSKATQFGIELEFEGFTADNLTKLRETLATHAIFKRDGSLSNGVEVATVPASVQQHKTALKKFFESDHSLVATPSCGIHIHIGRHNLSFLALGRMMRFFSENKDLIINIAGRESTNFARINTLGKVTTPWTSATHGRYEKLPKFAWSKYSALNLSPHATIEMRIFKGTTDWAEFCRFLEFAESFVDYCTLAGNDNGGKMRTLADFFKEEHFLAFVSSRGSAYPYLVKHLRAYKKIQTIAKEL